MKTLRDIIDFAWDSLKSCEKISCEDCPFYDWCYIDTYLLAINYLYKGEF